MDFDVAFYLVPVFDFVDVFPTRVSIIQHEVYLTEEPALNVQALAPPTPLTPWHCTQP